MTTFKIGDRVRLKPGHVYSDQNDGVGTIYNDYCGRGVYGEPMEWCVEWDIKKGGHAQSNVYGSEHLMMEEAASLLPKSDFSEDEIEQAREFIDG